MMSVSTTVLWVAVGLLISVSTGASAKRKHRQRNILPALLQDYDKNILPLENRPNVVSLKLAVNNLRLESGTQTMRTDVYLTETWRDPRLAFNSSRGASPLRVGTNALRSLWLPDIFVSNAYVVRTFNEPVVQKSMTLTPEGDVEYIARLSLATYCEELGEVSIGTPQCEIIFETWSYSAEELELRWQEDEAISLNVDSRLNDHLLQEHHIFDCAEFSIGGRPCIGVQLDFRPTYNG